MITVEEARKLYAATKAPLANHNDWYWCTEAVPALCDDLERLQYVVGDLMAENKRLRAELAQARGWTYNDLFAADGARAPQPTDSTPRIDKDGG